MIPLLLEKLGINPTRIKRLIKWVNISNLKKELQN